MHDVWYQGRIFNNMQPPEVKEILDTEFYASINLTYLARRPQNSIARCKNRPVDLACSCGSLVRCNNHFRR